MKDAYRYYLGLIMSGLVGIISSCSTIKPQGILRLQTKTPVEISVEIADTPSARTRGLKFRTQLNDLIAMLFIFQESKRHIFWMKNTPISLDLIFFDKNFTVVGIISNTKPESLSRLDIGIPSLYVLELSAGTAERFAITKHVQAQLILKR